MAQTPARQTESAQLSQWLQTWTTYYDATCYIASIIVVCAQAMVFTRVGLPLLPPSGREYGTIYAMWTFTVASLTICLSGASHLLSLTLYTAAFGMQCYITWLCWTTEARLEQLISLVAIAYSVIAQRAICLKQRQLFEARRN